jgi:predicted cupin superfamily sugar epimerase
VSGAEGLIATLGLQPHPEGGWYRETWRGPEGLDGRAVGTAIHFLLKAGERSHWHRVDAHEIWLWHAGDPLRLLLAAEDAGPVREAMLGGNSDAGQAVQHVVAAHEWQAAEPLPGPAGYVLVSCVVAPGFEFGGFELAPEGWAPGEQSADRPGG